MLHPFAWEHAAIRQDDKGRDEALPLGGNDTGTLQAPDSIHGVTRVTVDRGGHLDAKNWNWIDTHFTIPIRGLGVRNVMRWGHRSWLFREGGKRGRGRFLGLSARKQLNDLPYDVVTKITLFYYTAPRDALIKGLRE